MVADNFKVSPFKRALLVIFNFIAVGKSVSGFAIGVVNGFTIVILKSKTKNKIINFFKLVVAFLRYLNDYIINTINRKDFVEKSQKNNKFIIFY